VLAKFVGIKFILHVFKILKKMAAFGDFVSGVGVNFAWFCWYSVVEFFIIMYLLDEAVGRLLFKPGMYVYCLNPH
jgi:hypothetical protein